MGWGMSIAHNLLHMVSSKVAEDSSIAVMQTCACILSLVGKATHWRLEIATLGTVILLLDLYQVFLVIYLSVLHHHPAQLL